MRTHNESIHENCQADESTTYSCNTYSCTNVNLIYSCTFNISSIVRREGTVAASTLTHPHTPSYMRRQAPSNIHAPSSIQYPCSCKAPRTRPTPFSSNIHQAGRAYDAHPDPHAQTQTDTRQAKAIAMHADQRPCPPAPHTRSRTKSRSRSLSVACTDARGKQAQYGQHGRARSYI